MVYAEGVYRKPHEGQLGLPRTIVPQIKGGDQALRGWYFALRDVASAAHNKHCTSGWRQKSIGKKILQRDLSQMTREILESKTS